eukprot:Gb_28501 [translate_table: standard]
MMHDRSLKPLEDVLPCSRPLMQEQGLKPPPPDQALKCPRCDSSNTKFCYYNNYSLSQPRHFCKTCKRYWTRGGTLRNVPVGGGCRKNKRAKRTADQPTSVQINEASTSTASGNDLNINCSAPLGHTQMPSVTNSMFYGAHDSISLAIAARLGDQRAIHNFTNNNNSSSEFLRMSCGNQSSFDPHASLSSTALSSLSALSALSSLNAFKSNFAGLNFNSSSNRADHGTIGTVGDLSTFFESYPQISEASPVLNTNTSDSLSPFALSMEGLNSSNSDVQWRSSHQQKPESGHDGRALVPFEGHTLLDNIAAAAAARNHDKVLTGLQPSCIKVEEDQNRLIASEWHVPPEPLFETAGDSTSYWNGGAWPDLSSYGPSRKLAVQLQHEYLMHPVLNHAQKCKIDEQTIEIMEITILGRNKLWLSHGYVSLGSKAAGSCMVVPKLLPFRFGSLVSRHN